jgi:hypothetical protein
MVENPTVLPNGYGRKDPQEVEVFAECSGCRGEIYKGNDYWDFNGEFIHQLADCYEDYIADRSIGKVAGE